MKVFILMGKLRSLKVVLRGLNKQMFNNMIEPLSVVIRNIEFIKGSFLLRRWTLGIKSLIISRLYSWKGILNWSKSINLDGSRKGMPILSSFMLRSNVRSKECHFSF